MSEFDNINGIYAKDTILRDGIATLRNTVTSQTIKPLTVTQNGTYTASPAEGTYGYSPITVDVQEQPWQPLQDGYSNFWFELTDDTLSPWLNFSAKTEDAVIDWGDGTGEVALDTLTPTHTYSKAGKYVVKVKGVTGIARQNQVNTVTNYRRVLTALELNSEVAEIAQYGFWQCQNLNSFAINNSDMTFMESAFQSCGSLKNAVIPTNATALSSTVFYLCISLSAIVIPASVTSIGSSFLRNTALQSVTISSNVSQIGSYAFNACESLLEVHVQATIPPTLGSSVFSNLPANYIIYVPVGYGETYKATTRWSDYADHILEEGQTPNRAMLSRLAKAVDTDTDEEMR